MPKLDTRYRQDIAIRRRSSKESEDLAPKGPSINAVSNLFLKRNTNYPQEPDIKQTCMFGFPGDADSHQATNKVETSGNRTVEFNSFDPQEAEKRLSVPQKN